MSNILDLQTTLGAWFIGAIVSVGLLGVISLQCWTYFLRFPNDSGVLKALVLAVWALVCAKCVTSIHAGYYLAVVQWGNLVAVLTPIWSMKVMVLLAAIIIFLAHLFFAHKVWMLTRKGYWWISPIIMTFSLAHLGMGTATFVAAMAGTTYEGIILGQAGRFATGGLACAIITDWTITASLVIFLRAEKRSPSDIGLTKNFLGMLIFYAINIGLLVSLMDLVVLVLLNIRFKSLNFYQLMCYEIVSNLYGNTLLACLNMRSAPSSLELSELAKSHHHPSIVSHDRTLMNKRRISTSRPPSTRGGYEENSFVGIEMPMGEDEMLNNYPLATGRALSKGYVNPPSGWGRERVVTYPDIVVTKTTVTTIR